MYTILAHPLCNARAVTAYEQHSQMHSLRQPLKAQIHVYCGALFNATIILNRTHHRPCGIWQKFHLPTSYTNCTCVCVFEKSACRYVDIALTECETCGLPFSFAAPSIVYFDFHFRFNLIIKRFAYISFPKMFAVTAL